MSQYNSFYKQLGSLIGQKRVKRNLSQEKLAELLGVTKLTVCRWENGYNRPKDEMIQKICDVLKVDYEKLIFNATERAAQSKVDDIQNYNIRDTLRIPLYDDMPVDKLFSNEGLDKFITVSSHLLSLEKKYFALTMRFKTLNFDVGDILLFEHSTDYTEQSVLCVALKDGLYIVPPHLVELTDAKVIGVLRRALKTYEY